MNFFKELFATPKKKMEPKQAPRVDNLDALFAEMDAPWLKARAQYENTNMRQNAQIANWRIFAFILLLVVLVAVTGNVIQGSQSKKVPYLVEVDKLGRTIAVRSLEGGDAVTDKRRLVYREMIELIENLRTVSTDPKANKDHLTKAFARLKGAARNYADAELKRNPPNTVGGTQTVEIEVRAAIAITKKTWQVEWVENTYSLSGSLTKTENWKGSLTYEFEPSSLEENIRANPIGFEVNELSWMRII